MNAVVHAQLDWAVHPSCLGAWHQPCCSTAGPPLAPYRVHVSAPSSRSRPQSSSSQKPASLAQLQTATAHRIALPISQLSDIG